MHEFLPSAYGPVFAELLSCDRRRALDAGRPETAARQRLEAATLAAAFPTPVADRDMAACCLAAVWLLHDFLDESHSISQQVDTPAGSYWHGIMHRREGDFSNAKYWFRRVGAHPIYDELGPRLTEVAPSLAARLAPRGRFDPLAMVDAVQAALSSERELEAACRAVQQLEWELLFDHCHRAATPPPCPPV